MTDNDAQVGPDRDAHSTLAAAIDALDRRVVVIEHRMRELQDRLWFLARWGRNDQNALDEPRGPIE